MLTRLRSRFLFCTEEFQLWVSQNLVLQIYRNNIRWNPADEFCNQVIIKVREDRCWNLSGTLYSVVREIDVMVCSEVIE